MSSVTVGGLSQHLWYGDGQETLLLLTSHSPLSLSSPESPDCRCPESSLVEGACGPYCCLWSSMKEVHHVCPTQLWFPALLHLLRTYPRMENLWGHSFPKSSPGPHQGQFWLKTKKRRFTFLFSIFPSSRLQARDLEYSPDLSFLWATLLLHQVWTRGVDMARHEFPGRISHYT